MWQGLGLAFCRHIPGPTKKRETNHTLQISYIVFVKDHTGETQSMNSMTMN